MADTGGDGFVTAWPCDQPLPTASTINTWPNELRSNLAMVKLAADGTACLQLYTSDNTALDLVRRRGRLDQAGNVPGPAAAARPRRRPADAAPRATSRRCRSAATLPTDAQCAAAVRPTGEIRPDNAGYNADTWLDGSRAAGTPGSRATHAGTTDQIIQWAACKWGIDEDIVRAQAAKESAWHQNVGGGLVADGAGAAAPARRPTDRRAPNRSGSCRSASRPTGRRSPRR